jgi:glucose/mannose-6-phosphate isomerase
MRSEIMNLNDIQAFQTLDTQNMLAHIDTLPDQLRRAWELGSESPLPDWHHVQQIVVAGLGGSAIGGDLLSAYILPFCRVPVVIHRDYGLPAWAHGSQTLVIASSHSGNTEEVLDAFGEAQARGCSLLAITTGGALARQAEAASIPAWRFEHKGQPRAAVGFSFCLLLAALRRLEFVPDPASELDEAVSAMRAQQLHIQASVPDIHNPAKRLAGQPVGRLVTVFGSDILAPVARRWKGQINELAKAWGTFDNLPEADHNSLAGSINPPGSISRVVAIFLRAPSDHPRNRKRADLTRKSFMLNGIGTDYHDARGDSRLAHLWTALHYGDYVGYYLAMAYGVDPSPVDAIESFKKALDSQS